MALYELLEFEVQKSLLHQNVILVSYRLEWTTVLYLRLVDWQI